jgi:hypothetical protein
MVSKSRKEASKKKTRDSKRMAHEAEGGLSGAVAGAVLGAGAGPPGVVAGAILGGVAGALGGAVLDAESSRKAAHTRELDEEIGVVGGQIGAPNLKHPPATIGAFSSASAGAGGRTAREEPPTGANSPPEDD